MGDTGGAGSAPSRSLIIFALDHAFIDDETDGLAQDVYDALGALDVACPEAIAPIRIVDLHALTSAGLEASAGDSSDDPLQAAVRRIRHLLERHRSDARDRGATG